ncbi:MAG: YidC/Oxa1 family membrane protein insertase [Hungatella sp.]|nr:YidC/Oxa1 family membrane protein insertase [Hungatella sp.]
MDVLVLTKAGGILGPVAQVLGWIMEALFRFTSTFGVMNIGLCIILFTLVMKLLMLPLTLKQQKSSKLMSVMQPELQAIQKKYKGKNDNDSMMRMNVETKAVYEKYGTSMTGGCLPLLIQLPIMLALYRVMYNIPAYVSSVRNYFDLIIAKLPTGFASSEVFTGLAETHNLASVDYSNMDKVVDLLYKLTDKQWGELAAVFPDIAGVVSSAGENAIDAINNMQQFLGMNITYTPFNVLREFMVGGSEVSFVMALIALMIPVLSGLTQWYSTKLMTSVQPQTSDEENPSAAMMKSMNIYMPMMSVVFCFSFPLGIGLYWVASSVLQVIQQIGVNFYLRKVDVDELIRQNVEKANKKRGRKGLPPEKVNMNASQTLKAMEEAEKKAESARADKIARSREIAKESTAYYNQDAKPGSLAAKANMVQKYNERHKK